MAVEVILPRVDMEMTHGTISQWLANEGDTVAKGAPLFEIETDKAAMEIEAPASGVLRGVTAASGEAVAVGTCVAWIVAAGEDWAPPAAVSPDAAPAVETAAPEAAPAAAVAASTPATAPAQTVAVLRATPLARREAARHGIDLAAISGSGPRGRVVHDDVRQALEAGTAAPAQAALVPFPARPAGGALHIERAGPERGLPLVLLHGFGADLGNWRAIRLALEGTRRLLLIDLPGHGRSAEGATTHARLVAAVIVALREAGVERCHLVGHSLGGAVALGIAAAWPEAVASLGLIAPGGLGPEINGAFLRGYAAATRAESLVPWLHTLVADPRLITPSLVQAALRGQEVPGRRDHQRALIDTLFPDGTQALRLRDAVDGLTVPVKVIWGAADAVVPAHQARGLAGHVAVHVLPGIGHMPQVEAPALVARLLAELADAAGEAAPRAAAAAAR